MNKCYCLPGKNKNKKYGFSGLKNEDSLLLFATKMSNARIHMAGSELKKTQVPNSQDTKNSIKVTIWGELADLIFL